MDGRVMARGIGSLLKLRDTHGKVKAGTGGKEQDEDRNRGIERPMPIRSRIQNKDK